MDASFVHAGAHPPRRRKSARERREQQERSHARHIGHLLRASRSLLHRGSNPTVAMRDLAACFVGERPWLVTNVASNKVCRGFSSGYCRHGAECWYSHVRESGLVVATSARPPAPPPPPVAQVAGTEAVRRDEAAVPRAPVHPPPPLARVTGSEGERLDVAASSRAPVPPPPPLARVTGTEGERRDDHFARDATGTLVRTAPVPPPPPPLARVTGTEGVAVDQVTRAHVVAPAPPPTGHVGNWSLR
jgi:hypothetical protein